MVERNRVRLRAERASSEKAGTWSKETEFICRLEGSSINGRNGGGEETGFSCGLVGRELPWVRVVSIGRDSVGGRDWL